jgi:sugar phosphate isomerase/epimerase
MYNVPDTRTVFPFRAGTTSCILPDDVLPNIEYLANKVDDIELTIFESDAISPLPKQSVVSALANIAVQHDMTYTVHLPLDIAVGDTDEHLRRESVGKCIRVINRMQMLNPSGYILHCVQNNRDKTDCCSWLKRIEKSLREFSEAVSPELLFIETLDYPFDELAQLALRLNCNICLDVGHVLLYHSAPMDVINRYIDRSGIIHLHGVSDKKDHQGLNKLAPEVLPMVMNNLYSGNNASKLVTLEVFNKQDFISSLSLLKDWNQCRKLPC